MRVHFEKVLTGETRSFACREFCSRVFTAPFHFHPELELTVIVSGHGRRFVGDSVEDFGPGDVVLLGANLPHRWASTPPPPKGATSRSLVLQFRQDCLGAAFFDAPELVRVRGLLQRAQRGLQFGAAAEVRPLLKRLRSIEGGQRLTAFIEILEKLAVKEARALASTSYRGTTDAHAVARIDRVISYVERNYGDEMLALPAVARVASLAPSAFSRFFMRATGRNFVRFVNEVRLSHACRLLVETDRPVAEICFACGFGTLSNFHHRFRGAKLTTPREYRGLFQPSGNAIPRRFSG